MSPFPSPIDATSTSFELAHLDPQSSATGGNGTLRASGGVYPSWDEPRSFATCAMRKGGRSTFGRIGISRRLPFLSTSDLLAASDLNSGNAARPEARSEIGPIVLALGHLRFARQALSCAERSSPIPTTRRRLDSHLSDVAAQG